LYSPSEFIIKRKKKENKLRSGDVLSLSEFFFVGLNNGGKGFLNCPSKNQNEII